MVYNGLWGLASLIEPTPWYVMETTNSWIGEDVESGWGEIYVIRKNKIPFQFYKIWLTQVEFCTTYATISDSNSRRLSHVYKVVIDE